REVAVPEPYNPFSSPVENFWKSGSMGMSCKLPFRTLLGAVVTFGAVIPLGAQVVINEIHYQPAGASSNALEYVELRNISAGEVDLAGWALSEGVEYVFPPGTLLSE